MARGFSRSAVAAFELFFRPWMRSRLRGVRLAGLPVRLPARTPLLLIANHTSWWDPFLLRELQRRLRPAAPFYSVMLQRELARRPLLRPLGALGIDPRRPASVAAAVRELERRLRERPDACVAFFPQGRIWPAYRRPLGFRRGVDLLVRRLRPLTVLPVALHLEPLNAPSPTAFVLAGEPLAADDTGPGPARLEAEVRAGLDRLLAFLAEHGEDAGHVWPQPHHPLPAPTAPAGPPPAAQSPGTTAGSRRP